MIYIGRDEEHIKLEELERVPKHLPTPGDVRINATVRLQQFSGSYSGVWLARPELEKFVEQLSSLVGTNQGVAKLESMGPGEFSLEIRYASSTFEVVVQLGRHQYSGPTYWPTKLSGGFGIEGSQLGSILASFQSLLEPEVEMGSVLENGHI